jgi:hypothetical protein
VLVVPEAAGLDGGGVGEGDAGETEAVGVGVGLPVGLTRGERVGVVAGGRTEPELDPPGAVVRLTVGVGLPCRLVVGVGVWVVPGVVAGGS